MRASASRPSPTRVTLLLALFTATVVLASLLAYEAHDAARAERVTAERALHEYATMAAWEFQSSAHKLLDAAVLRALAPVTSGYASSPYEPLVPLEAVVASAERELPCDDGRLDSARTYVRLDLRNGAAVVLPSSPDAAWRQTLVDAVGDAARTIPSPETPYVVVFPLLGGARHALVAGARYARLGGPVGAYAFTVCAEALERRIPRAVASGHRLLPSEAAAGAPNDSLLALTVSRPGDGVLLRVGSDTGSPYHAKATLDELGGLIVDVALRPGAASRLVLGPTQRSRIPLLISLLVVTAALGALALVQIRREHELAELRADFTSSVSHELRTPLAQILLFGETLSLGRARTPDERRLAADTIVQEARRLMHMVDNILHFARARQGIATTTPSRVALAPLLRDVVASFAPLAEASGSRVSLEASEELAVRADATAVRQILLNLLDNATKYGRAGQVMLVSARRIDEIVELAVDDEGTGIPLNDRERIWMPYVRLSGNGAARGGSGLGLAVVRELAEALGGRVRVQDGARGGARFVVELPADRVAGEPSAAIPDAAAKTGAR